MEFQKTNNLLVKKLKHSLKPPLSCGTYFSDCTRQVRTCLTVGGQLLRALLSVSPLASLTRNMQWLLAD